MMHLVSSVSRSGSSMMMRCLAQSMPFKADDSHEYLNQRPYIEDGYVPNPNGFYAFDTDFSAPDFFTRYDGYLIKVPRRHLFRLPRGQYKMIFMVRHPVSILASMNQFMPGGMGEDIEIMFYDLLVPAWCEQLEARGDFEVTCVGYEDLLKDPKKEFEKLTKCGWVFDVDKAVAMVDVKLQRFKSEAK